MAVVKNHAVKQTVEYITDGSTKNQGKGKKDRYVPLSAQTLLDLRRYFVRSA